MSPPVLTQAQQTILHLLGDQEDLRDTFVLSGGTALAAFHLYHRRSDDLDFFSQEPVDNLRVRRFAEDVKQAVHASTVETQRIYDRHLFLFQLPDKTPLKLEFTHYPYTPVDEPLLHEHVRIESLRDIAADKLAALLDRYEPKDYYDIYVLLKEKKTTLNDMRNDLERKFSLRADPISLGAACMRANELPILPHLLQPIDPQDVKRFFIDIARSLRSDVLEE